ncbi:hypothetical protein TNCV_2283981 [Trichonephila clavipes]|nr:hypothetical protein TNCV_2283981 [Trichonephila clavipes]
MALGDSLPQINLGIQEIAEEAHWLSGSVSRFYATGLLFKPRTGPGRLKGSVKEYQACMLEAQNLTLQVVPNILRYATAFDLRHIQHASASSARRVFIGTWLEHMIRQPRACDLDL